MKKFIPLAISAVLAVSVLAGCGSSSTASTSTASAASSSAASSEQETEESTAEETASETPKLIAAAANTHVAHVDSVVAANAGLYAKEGLDVEMYYNPSNPECTQALLDGKVDLVSAGSTCVLNYIDQGEDIVIIGGQMTEGAALFALPERADEFSEINGETLAGKKVGVTRLQSGDIALRSYLSSAGVDLSTIEFVELDSCATVIEAVQKGQVDIGSVFMTFRETAEAQGLVAVKHIDELYPGFICCRLYTTRDKLEANRDAFKAAVKANIEAFHLINTDPDTAIKAIREGIDLDEELLRSEIYEYGHLTLDPNPAKKDIESFYQSMVDIGYANGGVDLDEHIDTSLFLEALDELLEENPDDEIYLALKERSDATNF